jgi:hypothetical protein
MKLQATYVETECAKHMRVGRPDPVEPVTADLRSLAAPTSTDQTLSLMKPAASSI